MKKRILSLFLVLVMALSLLPAQVFAASYTFDPNATIFTQNFTTETPRPNNLGEYFTVTSTPLSTADHTTTWNTGKNGTSVNVFNQSGSQTLGDTHAVLTFTFQKSCTFWFKFLFSISNSAPNSYAELFLNGSSLAKGTSSSKLTSPYSLDVKAGDVFKIDFYSEDDFGTPCQMTLKNIRCTDLAAQDVTVSFDPNQSSTRGTVSGAMAAQTVPAGTATALNANAFTNVYSMKISGTEFGGNVRFLGWNTAADGSGDSYADGADIAVSADTTLYAQWAGQNVTTHFEAGYPDAPAIADTISSVGSQYVIPEQPTRTQDGVEYKFVGWYTFPEGGEAITEKNATYGKPYIVRSMARATQEEANNGSVTFYARWVKRLSVSFDGNGYTGAFGTNNTWYTSQIDNQLKSVTENMFKSWNIGKVPVGKDFEGWYVKNADGSFGDKVYPLETPYNFTEKIPGDSMTLIANWVDKPVQDVTVSFDANGGEGTMAAQTLTEGKGTLNANTFTRENFRFAGWALSAAGEKVYDDGAAVELTADTTLYALWEAVQADLPVHFDGNGYQESIPNAAIGADGHVTLPTLSSAKFPSGQKYYDWYIVLADGTLGDRVTASYDFSAYRESGVTLKAQWYSRSYIICYHARTVDSGVTGSMDDQRAPFDQKIHLSACTLMREGYTFAGWSTSASIYGKVEYADGAELLREWSDGEWDDWEEDYVDGSEDGEHFDLYACWTKDMSDEEKAAREKLDAAKKLLEKTYQPSFKTDKNLLTMAQARLTAGNVEGVTVAMKSAVTQKDLFTDARAGIDLDGTLHYKWNDNGSTSASSLYCRATLLLTCNGYTDEVQDATVILGLDEDKALEALRTQGRRIVIPQELNDSTTLTSVPHYMVKEGVDESTVDYNSSSDLHLWAEVTWQSSNTSIIGISNNNSKLFAPYTVKVSRPKTDTDVTLTAALTYSGRDDLKVYFTYTVKVKGTQKAIDYQEALELWLAGGKEEPFGALYVPATGDPIDVDRVVTDIHFPTTSDMREIFAANYGADFDGKYTPILITSNNESVVQSLDANAARAWVYRPLPGQADAKVTLTVKILSRPSGSGKDYANMQVLASKDIPITVPAMSQSDIDAAAAFMREVCTEDVYWEGIRKANTDHSFVTGNLWPFMEIVPDGNGYKFIRTSAESQWTGVKVDDIDGWYDSQQYRCFRSSVPSVVAHETLLVTKPRYNTHVKIDSVLTYVEYGKYYEKFGSDPAYAQFKQFYKQPVSTVVTVIGTTGIEDPSIQDITVTVNVTGSTFAPDFTDLTAASYTCKSNAYKTAWDALESALTASSYTYEGSGSYVTAVTDAAGCRLGSGDPAHGPYSGWMFTVNGSMPMLDSETYATLGKYLLQANDRIDFYYVNCPTESGDHSWTEDTALRHEPTCTLDGSASYKCTMCGDTKTETLPAIGHKYGEPVWSWTGVESATATFTCEHDATHTQVVNATITNAVTKPATCTEDGVRTYTATVTFEGKTYTDTKTEAIKVTGHKYGEPVWSWTGVESATATFTCENDASHTQVVNATITSEVTKPATCTEDGVRTYTATVTFEGKTYTDTKTEAIKATGHKYGEPVWSWTGVESATATFTCENDASHTQVVNATITSEVTKEATCTEDGVRTYTATVTFNGKTYTDTKTETLPAIGHKYGEPVWSWTGVESATATFTCENDASHTQVVNATITSEVTKEATCTEDGVRTYTATVTFEGKTYTDTKTEAIKATGHKYGEPVWSWTGVESATATFTCENDASHTQVVNATITSEVTKEATCTEDGVRTYTATVTFNGKTYTDTKTETLPAIGHKYGEPVWSWTGVESATATFTCENDASHTQVVNATITSEVTKEATCTEDGVRTYTATVTFEGKTYTDTKTETIKATGEHTWDEGKVTTEPTCTEKGIKTYTCKKCSATKTEEINALGHDYVTKRTEPTCTEDGKLEEACSRCGDVKYSRVIPATGHNFRKNAQTGKYVCENCGKVLGESENTKPTKPTTPTKPGKNDTKFPFIDVSKNDRYYDAVDYLYNNGIMNGTTDTLFSPNAELTRAMVVTILYRAQGKPAVSTSGSFKDVAAGRYYTEAVEWAAANNIVKGFTDGTFKPDEPVTREQLAAFISRYAEYNGIEIVAADGKLDADVVVSNWAKKNVEWAVAEGILTSAQAKNATRNATRAEVAMALYTYLTKVAK